MFFTFSLNKKKRCGFVFALLILGLMRWMAPNRSNWNRIYYKLAASIYVFDVLIDLQFTNWKCSRHHNNNKAICSIVLYSRLRQFQNNYTNRMIEMLVLVKNYINSKLDRTCGTVSLEPYSSKYYVLWFARAQIIT